MKRLKNWILVKLGILKYENVFFKSSKIWIGSPVGFWDTKEIYDDLGICQAEVFIWKITYLHGADIRQCLKLNPRFLE